MTPVLHACAFEDNYIWLIPGESSREVAIVDPGDADPVFEALAAAKLQPCAILCTHHHGDHTGGVPDLLTRYSVPVYGPANERVRGMTHALHDGDEVHLASLGLRFTVLEIPGHTAGHIAFHGAGLLFCGDTLFSAGCGRLFEGTAEQMYRSLGRLAALPGDTAVYCGHEYTLANLRFALTVEPDNTAALAYRDEVLRLRECGQPTLPSTLERERAVNPFLRSHLPGVRQAAEQQAGTTLANPVSVFAALRRWKDHYRG